MNSPGSQKSFRNRILGCGCLVGVSAIGMGIVGILLILLGLFGGKASHDVAITSLGKTYEIHDRLVTGKNDVVVLKLTLTGKSFYKERNHTGHRRESRWDRELAFSIPLKLKVFDANSGELLHEHTQLLGYDRKKRGNPTDSPFIATMKTVNIPVPELGDAGDLRYELTLDENKDYEFTLQRGSFQLDKQEAGSHDKPPLGLRIVWLAVPTACIAVFILLIGLLVGRKNRVTLKA